MLSPVELYPAVHAWLQAVGAVPHAAGVASVAQVVTALLIGQSLRSASVARTLVSRPGVHARQRYRRVRRILTRPWLSSAHLTPWLVRAALTLVGDAVPHLALDTVRCGRWEVITVGVVWHGRMLPVGWEVLPYPWPKGAFTPAVLRLLWRIGAVWPADRRPHLVADRGFPSLKLFRTLESLGWTWTIRLRAKLTVGVDGAARARHEVIAASQPGVWTGRPSTYGTGRQRVAGHLVIGRGDAVRSCPSTRRTPVAWSTGASSRPPAGARCGTSIPAGGSPPLSRPMAGSSCSPPTPPGSTPARATRAGGRRRAAIAMPRAGTTASMAGTSNPPPPARPTPRSSTPSSDSGPSARSSSRPSAITSVGPTPRRSSTTSALAGPPPGDSASGCAAASPSPIIRVISDPGSSTPCATPPCTCASPSLLLPTLLPLRGSPVPPDPARTPVLPTPMPQPPHHAYHGPCWARKSAAPTSPDPHGPTVGEGEAPASGMVLPSPAHRERGWG